MRQNAPLPRRQHTPKSAAERRHRRFRDAHRSALRCVSVRVDVGGRRVAGFHRPGALAALWSGSPARTTAPPSMSTPATAVDRHQPVVSEVERTTLPGSLAGHRRFTREAYTLDLRQFTAWVLAAPSHAVRCPLRRHRVLCSRSRRPRHGTGVSLAGCARSSGSTATPRRKVSSNTPRRYTSAGRASTTSPCRSSRRPSSPTPATRRSSASSGRGHRRLTSSLPSNDPRRPSRTVRSIPPLRAVSKGQNGVDHSTTSVAFMLE